MARAPVHSSFYALAARLPELRAPRGDFDPRGPWKCLYGVYAPDFDHERGSRPIGRLALERRAHENGAELLARLEEEHDTQRMVREGKLLVRDDRLSTLVQWELETRLLPRRGKADRGKADGDKADGDKTDEVRTHLAHTLASWREKNGRPEESPMPSSDWSLIEALQRWPPEVEPSGTTFEVLEELENHRPEQRLQRLEPFELALGGESVRLSGFVRWGRGTTPVHYWLDPAGRVLFVLGYLRFLVWVESA
jgi:hypothetical protein